MAPQQPVESVSEILKNARNIAVFYANPRATAPAHYVPAYLRGQGYRVLPVHPAHAGKVLFGEAVVATLAELRVPIDIVDMFRRPETLPGHVPEILAMHPLPKVVWFQTGIINDVAAEMLRASGITVIQNRCTMQDHRRLS